MTATSLAAAMPVPTPRGPVGAAVLDALSARADPIDAVVAARALHERYEHDPVAVVEDDDAQVALALLYELHLGGVDGVDDAWEWDPRLLDARRHLEVPFEAALRSRTRSTVDAARRRHGPDVVGALWEMTAPSREPGLPGFMATAAGVEQFREVLVHRSLNQLREADVHTWGIPRLRGRPKAALVEIQADEYGEGRFERMHSQLFAATMRALGLSDGYAHYVDAVPAVTLAWLNALSFFGIHRRHIGALVGHLCAVETTSALPSKRYAAGLRRLGFGKDATRFFDEHVDADSVHEQIAVRDLAGGLVEQRPEYGDDVLFGAATCMLLDDMLAAHLTAAWARGESSLRAEVSLSGR